MSITDDAIRERHGCACRKDNDTASHVSVWEGEKYIHIETAYDGRCLTPWQARYLAAKLYRLSRRVRARTEALEVKPEPSKSLCAAELTQ